jgi:Arc/MetJ-type ribon-helix-helix transcriptional regulator
LRRWPRSDLKKFRWNDAVRLVLDETQLDRVRAEKEKAKKKSGDFTSADEDDETEGGA